MNNDSRSANNLKRILKEKLGIDPKLVRSRLDKYSGGSSVHLTLLSYDIDADKVESALAEFESIRRCEVSGEILLGGNRFVFVSYSDSIELSETLRAAVKSAAESVRFGDGFTPDSTKVYHYCNFLKQRHPERSETQWKAIIWASGVLR